MLPALQDAVNRLERIAQAEATEWLPPYYLTYAHLQLALDAMQQGDIEALQNRIEQAEKTLAAVQELTGETSHTLTLQGYIYQAYIWIDPMTNGGQYSGLAHAAYAKAAALDASNPRPLFLRGMLVLYTPEFFGGGAESALPLLEAAQDLFLQETAQEKGLLPPMGPGNQRLATPASTDGFSRERLELHDGIITLYAVCSSPGG
jgi:hypothetical protein